MRKINSCLCLALGALLFAPLAGADGGPEFEIKITNLTRGQVFTPVLAAAHSPGVQPFRPGTPASVELEILAESGNPGPLAALLLSLPEVLDGNVSDGPVPPGQTATIRVRTNGMAQHVSVLAMLVPTNDAFVALNTVPGPSGNKSRMFTALAWDAGTEANSESCDTIPGPPNVCQGEGFNEDRDDPNPTIHVHNGVHGVADLGPANYDWRNPVARVVITRVTGDDGADDEDDAEDDAEDDEHHEGAEEHDEDEDQNDLASRRRGRVFSD